MKKKTSCSPTPVKTAKLAKITPEAIAAQFKDVPVENKPVPPLPPGDWVCRAHTRDTNGYKDAEGKRCCEPGQAGITLPCDVVWNGEGPEPLPYDAAFITDNLEKFKDFFTTGGVLLFTQDGHWVYGHSFTIAPALIQRGASPETQVKVFLIVGEPNPRVDEQGRILVRKPAQVYQACQVPLAALLPAGFMRSQIVQAKNKIITPG